MISPDFTDLAAIEAAVTCGHSEAEVEAMLDVPAHERRMAEARGRQRRFQEHAERERRLLDGHQ